MRLEAEIRTRIADINADERMSYKTATVFENAPLALIQLEGEVVRLALEWVLGESPGCALSFRRTEPVQPRRRARKNTESNPAPGETDKETP